MLAALMLAPAVLVGQAPVPTEVADRELLNSERIESRFGSYGVEVLESGPRLRVSNLFSGSGRTRVCRTFAVVRYPAEIDPRLARAHQTILDGGSIGAVLAARGWRVDKTHLHYGELDSTPRSRQLMGGLARGPLAVHVYVLTAVRDDVRIPYATLAEVHHPEYLRLEDLPALYGEPEAGADAPTVAAMTALAAEKLR